MYIDKTYGLYIMTSFDGPFIFGYVGTPINVVIPTSIYDLTIKCIGGCYGFGCFALPFHNCQTLESIRIPKNVDLFVPLPSHPFMNCDNLKYVYYPKVTNVYMPRFDLILPDVEIIYYD